MCKMMDSISFSNNLTLESLSRSTVYSYTPKILWGISLKRCFAVFILYFSLEKIVILLFFSLKNQACFLSMKYHSAQENFQEITS